MNNETLIPLEKYAAMQRLSIYKVIQMANRGELQAKVVEKEGKKVTYIVTSAAETPQKAEAAAEAEEAVDYKAAYETLQKELQALKERMDQRDREQ